MTAGEIDRLCTNWLTDNYGDVIASKYRRESLVLPMWNPPDLNEALDTLRRLLGMAFGADESFGNTEYNEAKRKLRLPEERVQIPEAFIKAFAGTHGPG